MYKKYTKHIFLYICWNYLHILTRLSRNCSASFSLKCQTQTCEWMVDGFHQDFVWPAKEMNAGIPVMTNLKSSSEKMVISKCIEIIQTHHSVICFQTVKNKTKSYQFLEIWPHCALDQRREIPTTNILLITKGKAIN